MLCSNSSEVSDAGVDDDAGGDYDDVNDDDAGGDYVIMVMMITILRIMTMMRKLR